MRVAILEDDPISGEHLSQLMVESGHTPVAFCSGRTILNSLRHDSFDLLLLDWLVPDTSGIEVLSWAQENLHPSPPVIMISAKSRETDIVDCLASGADDYVTKPINDDVLKARVEAVLRRTYGATSPRGVEVYGDHVFDIDSRKVTIGGRPVATTPKEFALALLLFQNLDRPLSRTHILDAVWNSEPDIMSRSLDAHISQIRGRLGLKPENGLRLSSVYGFGYRLERTDSRG